MSEAIALTQIGGKYHAENRSLFPLKHRLTSLGVKVRHPIANSILHTQAGDGYAYDTQRSTFSSIETNYYGCIQTSTFHAVANDSVRQRGHLGASAAIEVAFALLHHKPVILLLDPVFADSVDPVISAIVARRLHMITIEDLLTRPIDEARESVMQVAKLGRVDYCLSFSEVDAVHVRVHAVLRAAKRRRIRRSHTPLPL